MVRKPEEVNGFLEERRFHLGVDRSRFGTGCGCQNELSCHFGLGKADGEATAEVRWPDGTVERFPGLKGNSCYRITRGGKPVSVPVTSK